MIRGVSEKCMNDTVDNNTKARFLSDPFWIVNIGLGGFLIWLNHIGDSYLHPPTDSSIETDAALIQLSKQCLEARSLQLKGFLVLFIFLNVAILYRNYLSKKTANI